MAAGAPWGELAMGGAYPGVFPVALRVAAAVQAALLVLFALVVLARAGVALSAWARPSRMVIWVVVAFSGVRAYPARSARTDTPVDTSRMRPLPDSHVAWLRGNRLVTTPLGPRTPRTHIPSGIGPKPRAQCDRSQRW